MFALSIENVAILKGTAVMSMAVETSEQMESCK